MAKTASNLQTFKLQNKEITEKNPKYIKGKVPKNCTGSVEDEWKLLRNTVITI
jgi:hypothetical protein